MQARGQSPQRSQAHKDLGMVCEQTSAAGKQCHIMKRKKPNELIIFGKRRKITYDSTSEGGSCELATGNITVGTANPREWFAILVHEIQEFILHHLGHRYSRYVDGNDGLRFVMTHHDFEVYSEELAAVLEQF